MYINLAWRNLWRNKRRTLITVASIFFAVLVAMFMRSMQYGTYAHMIRNTVEYFSGFAQIHANGYWDDKTLDNSFELTDDVIDAAKQNPHVRQVVPRLESFALTSAGERTRGVMVIGVDPEIEKTLTHLDERVTEGRYFEPDDQGVLLAIGVADYLKLAVGDTIVMISQGYRAMSAAAKYPILGIVEYPSPDLNGRLLYLPLKEAQWFYSAPNRLTSLALGLDRDNNLERVVADIRTRVSDDYEVMTWQEMTPELVQAIEADKAGGTIMLMILYFIVAFGIFGTILMMTAERRREFGILVAVGMRKTKLAIMLAIETLFITIIGVATGLLASVPILAYMVRHPIPLTGDMAEYMLQYGLEPIMPFSMDPHIFLDQAQIVFVLALLAAVYPIVMTLRLRSVDAMRA